MDLFAPCRRCLQCLPFFNTSPPPSPRLPTAPPASLPSADPSELSQEPRSSAIAPALDVPLEQDLPASVQGQDEAQHPPPSNIDSASSDFHGQVAADIADTETTPVSGIVIAPPVSSPPCDFAPDADTDEDAEKDKTTVHSFELPPIPFINDISFTTSGLMPLSAPITPALFGAGYGQPAGQYHPSPQVYPPGNGTPHDNNDVSSHNQNDSDSGHGHGHHEHGLPHHGHHSSHFGHSHSHDGHDSSHFGHDHPHHEHDASHDGYDASHDGHNDPHHSHGSLHHDHVSPHDMSPLSSVEESSLMSECLETDAKHDSENGGEHTTGSASMESTPIEAYHSDPVGGHDYAHVTQVGLGHSASHPGRRRREHFKEQLKGIKQQIKQGGHQLKEEGNKQLHTIIENMNKQAQQIEQSGSFFNVPRSGANSS